MNEEKEKADALLQISKKRAEMLLEALKRYPNKADPVYKDLVLELEGISRYWNVIESIEIKQTEANKNKYVNEAKKKLTGEAAKQYLRKRGVSIKKEDNAG